MGKDHPQAMATGILRWPGKDQVSTNQLEQQATAEAHLLQPMGGDHLDHRQHLVMPGKRHLGRLQTQRAMVDDLRRDHRPIPGVSVDSHHREVVQLLPEGTEDIHRARLRHPRCTPDSGRIRILEAMILTVGSHHPEPTKGNACDRNHRHHRCRFLPTKVPLGKR